MQLTEKVSSISETCFFLNRKNKNYCYLHEIYTSAKSEEASDKKIMAGARCTRVSSNAGLKLLRQL